MAPPYAPDVFEYADILRDLKSTPNLQNTTPVADHLILFAWRGYNLQYEPIRKVILGELEVFQPKLLAALRRIERKFGSAVLQLNDEPDIAGDDTEAWCEVSLANPRPGHSVRHCIDTMAVWFTSEALRYWERPVGRKLTVGGFANYVQTKLARLVELYQDLYWVAFSQALNDEWEHRNGGFSLGYEDPYHHRSRCQYFVDRYGHLAARYSWRIHQEYLLVEEGQERKLVKKQATCYAGSEWLLIKSATSGYIQKSNELAETSACGSWVWYYEDYDRPVDFYPRGIPPQPPPPQLSLFIPQVPQLPLIIQPTHLPQAPQHPQPLQAPQAAQAPHATPSPPRQASKTEAVPKTKNGPATTKASGTKSKTRPQIMARSSKQKVEADEEFELSEEKSMVQKFVLPLKSRKRKQAASVEFDTPPEPPVKRAKRGASSLDEIGTNLPNDEVSESAPRMNSGKRRQADPEEEDPSFERAAKRPRRGVVSQGNVVARPSTNRFSRTVHPSIEPSASPPPKQKRKGPTGEEFESQGDELLTPPPIPPPKRQKATASFSQSYNSPAAKSPKKVRRSRTNKEVSNSSSSTPVEADSESDEEPFIRGRHPVNNLLTPISPIEEEKEAVVASENDSGSRENSKVEGEEGGKEDVSADGPPAVRRSGRDRNSKKSVAEQYQSQWAVIGYDFKKNGFKKGSRKDLH